MPRMMDDKEWEFLAKRISEDGYEPCSGRNILADDISTNENEKKSNTRDYIEYGASPIPQVRRRDGSLVPRTEKTLKYIAIERGLAVGKKARIERRGQAKDHTWILRKVENGTVEGIYDHSFSVKVGNHTEYFRYNELFGDEQTKVRIRK